LGAHFLILVCELHAPTGEPREQNEGAVAWFTWPEIERLQAAAEIVPSDYAMIRYFRDRTAATIAHIEAEMITTIQDDGRVPPTLVRFEPVMPPPTSLLPRQFLGQSVTVVIDRPLGSRHPQWGFVYPLNYGRVPGVPGGDGEDLDAYVLGVYDPLDIFSGRCIAILRRRDDDDDKLILAPPGVTFSDEQILALTAFQERFFDPVILRGDEN
jgi:inorganic pyrophosphatase